MLMPENEPMPLIELPKPNERDWFECAFFNYARSITHHLLSERGCKL